MIKAKRDYPDSVTETLYKIGKWAFLLFIITIAIFALWGDTLTHARFGCRFFHATGIYCPGCGGTRAFYYMMQGRLLHSFLSNPFVLYATALYLVFMGNTFLYKHTQNKGFCRFPITILMYIGVGILIGQWIFRNILWLGFHITCL